MTLDDPNHVSLPFIAICESNGCANAGVPVEAAVAVQWPLYDVDGNFLGVETTDTPEVICGPCGAQIHNLTPHT